LEDSERFDKRKSAERGDVSNFPKGDLLQKGHKDKGSESGSEQLPRDFIESKEEISPSGTQ
jgi:hypothetical protein